MKTFEYVTIIFSIYISIGLVLNYVNQSENRIINEIHNHNKCDSIINYQQGFIEYFKLEHPEVDLIEAREYSHKNK
jgi:hypothetical protein